MIPLLRASHVQPAVAVTAMTTALAVAAGRGWSSVWVALALLSGQLFVGWSNDWLDRERDRRSGRSDKPIAAGEVAASAVGRAALVAVALCVPLSLANGWRAGLVHLAAVASAGLYNLRVKATVASPLPYAFSFGSLPYVVTYGLPGHPAPRPWAPLAASLLGMGAHFVNTLPDQGDDLREGIRGLPQRIGRTPSLLCGAALLLAAGVALAVLPDGGPGAAIVLLGAQAACVAALVVAARLGRERLAWTLTIGSAVLAVALLLAQGSALA
ncbi:MAG TPA: UbiA family prenyltransferase [Mycobacteriales bacterium]